MGSKMKFIRLMGCLMCFVFLAACGGASVSEGSTPNVESTPMAGNETDNMVDESTVEKPDPTSAENENRIHLGEFETQTLDAQTVSQNVFSDYDLTVVNIWATWCPPCIEEMPDLQVLYEQLPENVNFFTISDDANEQPELAQSILEESGATFDTLLTNEQIDANIMSRVAAFPTTLFVNSEGYVVHAIEGVPVDDPVQEYLDTIDGVLEQL